MIPIVDTHQYLWDLSKFKLGWFKDGDPLAQSFTPVEYAEAIKGLNVVKSVYIKVDVVPEQQQAEADYVTELCKAGNTPMVAAVVSGAARIGWFRQVGWPVQGQQVRQRHPPGDSPGQRTAGLLPAAGVREERVTAG